MNKTLFGMTTAGEAVYKYSIKNCQGMKAVIMDFGATIVDLWVPDREGRFRDVCLGYEDVASFEADYGKEAVMEAITADYVMDYVISQSTVIKAEDNKESEQ
jgi:aldose 1-epimerase